ncbi:hypothetical protein EMEDMD4_310161 [Sinorhizobium medicae]|uniref:Uncharacterized protein n=1 Tax=Sinorhizobium medicae TaxID=110321 RepID=A0A508X246_9HYPH|nr:hypothetical protein EMEDMD4_310161 [Sinorhizobium medicae]
MCGVSKHCSNHCASFETRSDAVRETCRDHELKARAGMRVARSTLAKKKARRQGAPGLDQSARGGIFNGRECS